MPSYRSRPFFVPEIEGQMGVKMGQKRVFRNFLKNCWTDSVPSPREGRYHHSTYSCQVSSPYNFSFPIYRTKWGSKGVKNEFFVIFSKTSKPISFHLLVKEDIIILRMCAKFQVQTIFCSQDMGSNRVKMNQKLSFWGFLKNDCNNLVHSLSEDFLGN